VNAPSPVDGGPCIVVGYDGSEAAREAVAYAARRAGRQGKVHVVHCFGPPPDWLGAPNYQRMLDDHQGRGKAILDALVLEGGDALVDVDYELELLGGHPAEAIVKVAETRDADEIVIGSRGFGRLRAALGSVSHEVLHLADRPVVVVPHGKAHAGAKP
jgi:nucleotide-binding universal stress UspA family protein